MKLYKNIHKKHTLLACIRIQTTRKIQLHGRIIHVLAQNTGSEKGWCKIVDAEIVFTKITAQKGSVPLSGGGAEKSVRQWRTRTKDVLISCRFFAFAFNLRLCSTRHLCILLGNCFLFAVEPWLEDSELALQGIRSNCCLIRGNL